MKRKIFDCTTFFNSNHLFEIRFNILRDIVDYFVVCESNTTHTGKKKRYNFDLNHWKKYKNKIIYIKVKDLPKVNLTQKNKFELIKIQIENLFKGISKANDQDLIILSDEDEIPNPNKIKLFNYKKYKFGIFLQNLYYYKINIQNLSEAKNGWPGSRIALKKNIKSFFKFRILKIKNKDEPFWKFYKEKSIQTINKAGWHFTYLMTPKLISMKIKNSGHIEFNKKNYTSIKNINHRIKNLIDPFDREANLKKVKIDKTFPEYILRNKKKLKKWIS
tara:strand:- start:999 stop:1823 length:825 start_codon:yes stop_codon:yes gene_type:complete